MKFSWKGFFECLLFMVLGFLGIMIFFGILISGLVTITDEWNTISINPKLIAAVAWVVFCAVFTTAIIEGFSRASRERHRLFR